MPKQMVRVRDMSVPRETNSLERASRTARGNVSELTVFSSAKCTGDEMISSLSDSRFPLLYSVLDIMLRSQLLLISR